MLSCLKTAKIFYHLCLYSEIFTRFTGRITLTKHGLSREIKCHYWYFCKRVIISDVIGNKKVVVDLRIIFVWTQVQEEERLNRLIMQNLGKLEDNN